MGKTRTEHRATKGSKGNRGYVLVTVALAMTALLGITALAVDVGFAYSKRSNYQRAADAAALAGAFTYVVETRSPQPATATAHAVAVAANNPAMGTAIPASDVTVTVGTSPVGSTTVTVDIRGSSPTFFARVFSVSSVAINVTATAEVAPHPAPASCLKPWFMTNSVLASSLAPPLDPCVACTDQNPATSKLLIAGSGAAGYNTTAYAQSQYGARISIKPDSPSGALGPSDYFLFDLPGSVGGNDYRNNIATCNSNLGVCRDLYTMEPGNKVGPTRQGVAELLGNSPDTYISVGDYQLGTGGNSDVSHQLVLCPIWDICNTGGIPGNKAYCPGHNAPQGRDKLGVVGFAIVFIEGFQNNMVVGRLIRVTGCGIPGGAENGAAPYAIPVRLVKP